MRLLRRYHLFARSILSLEIFQNYFTKNALFAGISGAFLMRCAENLSPMEKNDCKFSTKGVFLIKIVFLDPILQTALTIVGCQNPIAGYFGQDSNDLTLQINNFY